MKNQLFKIASLALLTLGVFSCKKQYGEYELAPLQDSVADVPVTVTNANAVERFPIIYTSLAAGGQFTINFEIPSDKGTIKEITKVATGAASAAITLTALNSSAPSTALNASGTGTNRVVTPIPGNGTNKISYTSDLTNGYLPYRIAVGVGAGPIGPNAGTPSVPTVPQPSTSQTPQEIQYYFLITLEGGRTIIPMPVRIRVLP